MCTCPGRVPVIEKVRIGDSGKIILQREFHDIVSTWPYPRVLRSLMARAPEMIWEAIDALEGEGFEPQQNNPVDNARRLATLNTARKYRATLARRRGRFHPSRLVYELTRLLDREDLDREGTQTGGTQPKRTKKANEE